jgi:hypothetical protein
VCSHARPAGRVGRRLAPIDRNPGHVKLEVNCTIALITYRAQES